MVASNHVIETRLDRNLERILYNSSANIASLISLARLHEETVSRAIRNQSTNQSNLINLITGIIETNAANVQNGTEEEEEEFVPLLIGNTELFNECKYNTIPIPLNTTCPISFDNFNGEDNVIVIKKCNHIFKKTSLERWLQRSHCCPYCRTVIN
jgi:hypothetical protein